MKVSIIIPVYNCESLIKETLESVLKQTYKDIEVVVIDDGSTDRTAHIVKQYNGQLKYVYQENQGISAARNAGLIRSKGEYLVFLDHDDLMFPEAIEKQVAVLEREKNCAFVFSDTYLINEKGIILARHNKGNDGPKTFERLFKGNFILTPGVVLFRRKAVEDAGGFDLDIERAGDYDLLLRLSRKYKFEYIDQPLIKYRVHINNASRDILRMAEDEIRVFKKAEIVKGVGFWKRQIRMAKVYHNAAEKMFAREEYKRAGKYYLKTIFTFPLVGLYWWPEEVRRVRFSFFYRLLVVYFKALECFLRRV